MYLMNRDGFTLLAMGFTGKEAMEWKLKYIAAFNAMEAELKKQHEQPKQENPPITALGKAIHDLPNVVNVIQSMFKVHDGIAMAQAIDLTTNLSGLDISSLKQLIPSAKHKTGFMNATQVGEKLGVKARVVNRTLAQFGYIEKIDDDWRLTAKGFDYGEEMPYTTNNGHSYSYPTRDTILDIKETAKVLLDIRPDLDQQIAMDVAISLVEKRACCDLSVFRDFLSIAKLDKEANTRIPSYQIMNCDCKEE